MNTISNDMRIALLCELAHNRVEEADTSYIIDNYNGDGTKYTEDGQELFNGHYDYYEGILLNHLKLVDNPKYKKEVK
jgi:hypothetical protein